MKHQILNFSPKPRGFHLITDELVDQLSLPESGILFLQLMHTSAGLTLNENADPTVRLDFEGFINRLVPENQPYFQHTYEGADDMPAHIKSSIFGTQLQMIIKDSKLVLGTWQGIYLCEFRDHATSRRISAYVL